MFVPFSLLPDHSDVYIRRPLVLVPVMMLLSIFSSVSEIYLERLSIYADMPLTEGMMDILARIMVEVLSVLALATKQIK